MSNYIDYYKTLQVHPDAEQNIIDVAYRCLCKIYHPDVNNNKTAIERMQSINRAYDAIGNARKRREYHSEWLRHNKDQMASTSSHIIRNEPKQPKETRESKDAEEALKIDLAYKVLHEFFRLMVNEEYEPAYQKLTIADKENISLEDFIEWKKVVSKLYKLGSFKINYFSKYYNCDYSGLCYSEILHFAVTLNEMQLATGQVTEECTQKYVAYDNNEWRICFGYTDLKPSIKKFKDLADSAFKEKTNKEKAVVETKEDPRTKLGKYQFSDILNFNKRGKNHY